MGTVLVVRIPREPAPASQRGEDSSLVFGCVVRSSSVGRSCLATVKSVAALLVRRCPLVSGDLMNPSAAHCAASQSHSVAL